MPTLTMRLVVTDATSPEEAARACAMAFAAAVPSLANDIEIAPEQLASAMAMELLVELQTQGFSGCVQSVVSGARRMMVAAGNDRGEATLQ